MMTGMMLPSALPMILLFAAVERRHAAHPARAIAVFAAGYLLARGGFSVVAAVIQDRLADAMLLSAFLSLVEPWGRQHLVPGGRPLRAFAGQGTMP